MTACKSSVAPEMCRNRPLIYTSLHPHDSVVSLALPFVTLTPSCFALDTISTLFLDETACAILFLLSVTQIRPLIFHDRENVLRGVGLVVHEQELKVAGVVDKESLVSRGHEVAGLPVRAISDL